MGHGLRREPGMTRYDFVLPRTLRVEDCLSPQLSTRADDARWLMSTIVRKTAHRAVDSWGFVRLHTQVLRRMMAPNSIAPIVRAMEAGGAIETASYVAGVRCKGYRLARRFLGNRCDRVQATDSRLIERIEAEQVRLRNEQRAKWQPIHYMLDVEQSQVTVTTDADEILEGLPDHTRLCQDVLLSNIRNRQWHFSVSSTGRVFNCITGIKRELRTTLRLCGETMGNVDIICAQPALLGMMIRMNASPFSPSAPDFETYKHTPPVNPPCLPGSCLALLPSSDSADFVLLASAGLLYESLMADTGLDRDVVKLAVLRDVLAKRGRYPSTVEDAFRDAFPTVYRIIRTVNRRDHGELIRLLQRAESWLVIERVAPRLLGKVPVLTLHDALFSQQRDVPKVADGFRQAFEELGFKMALKMS